MIDAGISGDGVNAAGSGRKAAAYWIFYFHCFVWMWKINLVQRVFLRIKEFLLLISILCSSVHCFNIFKGRYGAACCWSSYSKRSLLTPSQILLEIHFIGVVFEIILRVVHGRHHHSVCLRHQRLSEQHLYSIMSIVLWMNLWRRGLRCLTIHPHWDSLAVRLHSFRQVEFEVVLL